MITPMKITIPKQYYMLIQLLTGNSKRGFDMDIMYLQAVIVHRLVIDDFF